MFQRRTSRRRTRESRDRMLALKVQSPRILFFDFLKLGGRFMKFGLILMAVMALGFVGRLGWEELFVKNTEEFGIKEVPLTDFEGEAPRFLTHSRIVATTGLDLDASIFALDTGELEETLRNLPETTQARVTRRLPGTLKIEVSERTPVAWLDCDQLGIVQRDRAAGLLIDETGVPFKCASQTLWDFAERLPVIRVLQAEDHEIMEGQEIKHEGLQYALDLVNLASASMEGFERPAWVIVKDEITLEMMTLGKTIVTLSFYEQEHQLQKLTKIIGHARAKGRELKSVNLIPDRFVPVMYRDEL
jgi:hypothetical protein